MKRIAVGYNFSGDKTTTLYGVGDDNTGLDYRGNWKHYTKIVMVSGEFSDAIKPKHVHYSNVKFPRTFICGSENKSDRIGTTELHLVTCIRCIDELKKLHYHCDVHGFINGHEVTFDEKCAICGLDV